MKKRLKNVFKVIGISLLVLVIAAVVVYFTNANYSMYSLHLEENSPLSKLRDSDDYEQDIKELVSQMTLEEKTEQLYGSEMNIPKFVVNFVIRDRFPHFYSSKNERLGIPPWVLSDGPRGAVVRDKEVDAVTTFPVSMARGASWDTDLEYRINKVISQEMRANKSNYAATPCINILRHPGWGRAQETYGEDPWHMGEFGVSAVNGIQENNVMACPKHFALNSIENSRLIVDVEVDERTLREVYLPHFKKVIQEAKPASMMTAFNKVNGEQCSSNKVLLTDILRNEWGFEGFVTTDWIFGLHKTSEAIKAGLNVEMPWGDEFSLKNIERALENNEIEESEIDDIIFNTLSTRLKYALKNDQDKYPHDIIATNSSIALAKEAAEASMVLLKNDDLLPYKNGRGKKIAVIGRIADMENTGDHGSSITFSEYVITPYQGIKNYNKKLGNEVIFNDGSDLESAKKLAKSVDEVILVVGFTFEDEGEHFGTSFKPIEQSNEWAEAGYATSNVGKGGDREDLSLLQSDENLIQNLSGLNAKMTVVYIGGSAIDMSSWIDKVPAILFAWYAGMEGGTALANILYGNVNPSGKLPFSIAKKQEDYPYFTPYTKKITYDYYHGYTLFDKKGIEPAFPFGKGLSYSKFSIDSLKIEKDVLRLTDTLRTTTAITNNSDVAGKEVVQLYVGFRNSKVDRPVKLLRDFEKVHVAPWETKIVELEVKIEDLAWYNPDAQSWEIEEMQYELYIGNSSSTEDLHETTFTIEANGFSNEAPNQNHLLMHTDQ